MFVTESNKLKYFFFLQRKGDVIWSSDIACVTIAVCE